MSKREIIRLEVTIGSAEADALRLDRDKNGTSLTESVRRAIALLAMRECADNEGNSMVTVDHRDEPPVVLEIPDPCYSVQAADTTRDGQPHVPDGATSLLAVNLAQTVASQLEKYSVQHECTVTEAVKRAIGLLSLMNAASSDRRELVIRVVSQEVPVLRKVTDGYGSASL